MPALGPAPLTAWASALDQPREGLRHRQVPIRLLVFIAVFVATSVPFGLVGSMLHLSRLGEAYYFSTAQLVSALVAYAVLLWFEKRHPVELDPRRWTGVLAGLLLGTLGMVLIFGIVWAMGGRTIHRLGGPFDWQVVFTAGLVAGISEEIIFRGVLFRLVEHWLGTWGATALSGIIFGAVHMSNKNATLVGALGIALEAGVLFALLYAWSRNLWLLMGFHGAWNVVQGPVLGSAISGATSNGYGYVVSAPKGPELLSGGVFGLEASIVTVLVWSLLSAWLAVQMHRRGLVVAPSWVRQRQATPEL